ncbi:hypothetical protein HDV04_003924 [Boothiomyces sp. JEL0838]|nr:hypothetical protein HDV04_003924 [Boothiomyces sp. JEL0838]
MLPSEVNNEIPKSVLRYIWSTKVLKAGLGVQSEAEVRDWFHRNPHILNEFEKLNHQLLLGIKELQQTAIRGLKNETRDEEKAFNSNKRARIE